MKRFLWFCLASALTIGLAAWGGVAAFGDRVGAEGVEAIVMSAGVAFVVQCLTFGVAMAIFPVNWMLGWGAGMLIRFFTILVHGIVGVKLLGLRADAALLSLAAFLFLTSLIEPFFLVRPTAAGPDTKPTARPS
ncbi:MAG TPA: hypothetical protein VJR92_05960 [Gemmatimonadaceae bacterium]|nr:hypothetical protein [Gemmatimonadaceae bacterium]